MIRINNLCSYREFVDIAGLVKGAKVKVWGTSFYPISVRLTLLFMLSELSKMVNIVHVDGSVDPVRDIETINYELIMSDLEILDRRIDKIMKSIRGGEKKYLAYQDFL